MIPFFKITTQSTSVILYDLGERTFVHPTTNYDLLLEYSLEELKKSVDLMAALEGGTLTADFKGQSIVSANDFYNCTGSSSGFSGYSGTNGVSGAGGFSGFSGYSGTNGVSGADGFSGFSGYSGTNGVSGNGLPPRNPNEIAFYATTTTISGDPCFTWNPNTQKFLIKCGSVDPTESAPLSIISDSDTYVLTLEDPNVTTAPVFGILNMPLSNSVLNGKAIEVKVSGEPWGRIMIYSNGNYGIGPGSTTRDTILSRAGNGIFRISSDGGTGIGGGGLEIMGRLSIGGALVSGVQESITQAAANSGSPTALRVTGGAHTTLTASTEAVDFDFAANRTVQFATGALATQRSALFRAPTLSFVAASTVANAATLAIAGAPVAGPNATLTSSMALWIQAGFSKFDGVIGVSDGTATLPALAFSSDLNTGLYNIGTDRIGITTGGILRFDISTTAVTSTLKIIGPASVAGAASFNSPHGTAPSAPVNGDEWTTTAGKFIRISGVTTNMTRLVTALTDAVTINIDSATGDLFTITLGGNRTVAAPTNPVNGRLLRLRIRQGPPGSRTLTWNSVFKFTTSLPAPTLSTASNKIDYIEFIYDSETANWHCISYVLGHN